MLLGLILSFCIAEHPWLTNNEGDTLANRFKPPNGFVRIEIPTNSFAHWLRNLPLLDGNPDVLLFNGKRKRNQTAQLAVLNMDVGKRDLQQCADAVMRLRAEYLYAHDQPISFNFTSGDAAKWALWSQGQRPQIQGNNVIWHQTANVDDSYASFRKYLNIVFSYAGTYSLSRELERVSDPSLIESGDVFIQGGFPGHAVLVADVVQNKSGERMFILVQSYMPAQQIHVLRNPLNSGSVWYSAKVNGTLRTPEWAFEYTDLHRF